MISVIHYRVYKLENSEKVYKYSALISPEGDFMALGEDFFFEKSKGRRLFFVKIGGEKNLIEKRAGENIFLA